MTTKTAPAAAPQAGDLKEMHEIVKNILMVVQQMSEGQGEQLKKIQAALADLGKATPTKPSRKPAAAKSKDAAFPKSAKLWFIEQWKSEEGEAFRARYKTIFEEITKDKKYTDASDKPTYAATKVFTCLAKRVDFPDEDKKIAKQFNEARDEYMAKHGVSATASTSASAPSESLESAAAKPPAKGKGKGKDKKAPAPATIPAVKDDSEEAEAGDEASGEDEDEVVPAPKAAAKPKKS